MSAASFATSVPVSTEMPTSAWCSDGVVHAVAHERDVGAARSLHAHDPRLRLRPDAREDRRRVDRGLELRIGHCVDLLAGQRAQRVQAQIAAHLDRDLRAVAGDHLHHDSEPIEPRQRGRGVGLRAVDEHEEAGELEVLLVGVARGGQTGRARAPTAMTRAPESYSAESVAAASAARRRCVATRSRVHLSRSASECHRVRRPRPSRAGARDRTGAPLRASSSGPPRRTPPRLRPRARRRARCRSRPCPRRARLRYTPDRADAGARPAPSRPASVERDVAFGQRSRLVREQAA